MEIVSKIMNSEDEVNVVWLAHTRELCEQGLQCFKQVWPHHNLEKRKLESIGVGGSILCRYHCQEVQTFFSLGLIN